MRISVCLFITLFIQFSVFSQWVQTGGPNGGNTQEIFQMGSELIVSAGNGGIYKSLDNGDNWKLSIAGLPCNPYIFVLAESDGLLYASIYQNGIYVSNDKGNNWDPINSGIQNETFYSLFVDGTFIYAGSSEGKVYQSSDKGLTWTNKSNGISNDPLFTNSVTDFVKYNTKIYAAGTFLYETSDQGENWIKVPIPNLNVNGLSALFVYQNVFYGSSEGVIYTSSDDLNTWQTQIIDNNSST